LYDFDNYNFTMGWTRRSNGDIRNAYNILFLNQLTKRPPWRAQNIMGR